VTLVRCHLGALALAQGDHWSLPVLRRIIGGPSGCLRLIRSQAGPAPH
jgi:hypothetical protein